MCQCPGSNARRGDPCEKHCPRENDHDRYFAKGQPAPCGCTPSNA
ncbi:hypothetical protein [Streptomyces microflavus]